MFLVHPRDVADLHAVGGSSVVRQYCASEDEFRDHMCASPPTVIGTVTFGLGPLRGELVAVPRMPEQLLSSAEGRRCVVEAVNLAAQRGTAVIGLGALTAPATRGGRSLLASLPRRVTLTTGNAYTAAVARRNVDEAAAALGLGGDAIVAVVGATGSVGVPTAHLLAESGYRLVLIGRTAAKVERALGALAGRAALSGSLGDVAGADVVLLLTSDSSARLGAELPRPGSVVVDLAHPANVPRERHGDFLARGVRVVEGGLVRIPGYHCTHDLRLADRHSTVACLAETYMFAKEGIREHSVGTASVALARDLDEVAARHGVRPTPLALTSEPVGVR